LHPFAVEFKPIQQALLVVGNVLSRAAVSLQQSFFFSPYKYDIDISFGCLVFLAFL
jgi:hypothetical protein